MGKTRRFALSLGLATAVCANAGLAFADPEDDSNDDKPAATSSDPSAAQGRREARADESPEERLARRRERLEQGAKRLRERAEEMKKKAAAGETPATSPNAKRPPRSFAEQAQRLEEQAAKMEERSKNLTVNDTPATRGPERAQSSRQRRHQVRRIQLNRRWGDTLKDPEAVSELKLHAERSAQLKRIRTLALKKSKDDPMADRATKLLAKEVARHEAHMKELQAKSVAASVASGAAPAAAPSAAPPSETPPATTAPAAAPEEENK
ncbi:MAG TPA: hypothetical protein VMG12_08665 [Polyangiaceae bacterium]|nr:hypothetical protein [Polyangiaceae bacterium]